MPRILITLAVAVMMFAALGTRSQEVIELWLDGGDTYLCDDPFEEAGLTVWLAETTEDDCPGAGFCDFGWAEGVIYMHPVRLVVDVSTVGPIDSVEVYCWVTTEDDLRIFLYDDGEIIEQVNCDFYGGHMMIYGHGLSYDEFVVSACDAEFYEAYIYTGEQVDVPPDAPVNLARLAPPYPNPFNPRTTLSYYVPEDGCVSLSIHDVAGRRLRSLIVDGHVEQGEHNMDWDGRADGGALLASGVYIARLETPFGTECRSLRLVK